MLEYRREGRQQVVDQAVDISHELAGGTRRQLQRSGFARLIEMIDVDPVSRGLQALGFSFEVAFDEGETPGAGLAHNKHVITGARHGHTELQRLDGALLTQYATEGFQVFSIGEVELLRGKGTGKCFRCQPQMGCDGVWHWKSLDGGLVEIMAASARIHKPKGAS